MAEVKVKVRRVYEEPAEGDGTRVLVDRIWPRVLTKARAALDEWCKEVAPSTELRKWYSHDPELFEEFGRHYQAELEEPERAAALAHLRELAKVSVLTSDRDQAARDQRGSRARPAAPGLTSPQPGSHSEPPVSPEASGRTTAAGRAAKAHVPRHRDPPPGPAPAAVLRELEIRALEDDWRRREEGRRAEDRRRRWEQAMARARHDHRQMARATELTGQLERWRLAGEIDQ
jgi:uncharacterized protein YeaO (DUF488 family)